MDFNQPVDIAKDDDGWTALMWAAHENALDVIRLLVKRGADVNAGGGYIEQYNAGIRPLMCAAQNNATDAVKLLIELGADVNARDA